jgi:hypothetical protein
MALTENASTAKARGWWGKLIALVLLLISCMVAFGLGILNRSNKIENSGLVVSPEWLHIGEVYEDDAFHWKLRVHNPTGEDIHILGFNTSCNCTRIQPSETVVPARSFSDLELVIDLSRVPKQGQDNKDADFREIVVPTIRGAVKRPKGWTLDGKVLYPLVIEPQRVVFEFPLAPNGNRHAKQVKVVPHPSLVANLDVRCDLNKGNVVITKSKREYELTISPDPQLGGGTFDFFVTLNPIGMNGKQLPAKKVHVMGQIADPIKCLPPQLSLGPRRIGTVVSESISLVSTSGEPFEVTGIEPASSEVQVESCLPPNPAGSVIRLRQVIKNAGYSQSAIAFQVKQGRIQDRVSCLISYYGTRASSGK